VSGGRFQYHPDRERQCFFLLGALDAAGDGSGDARDWAGILRACVRVRGRKDRPSSNAREVRLVVATRRFMGAVRIDHLR
jgi:hypothetical protein